MKTITINKTINVYTYEELSAEAKEIAVDNFLTNLNWYDFEHYFENVINFLVDDINKKYKCNIKSNYIEWEVVGRDGRCAIDSTDLKQIVCAQYSDEINKLYLPSKFGVYLSHLGGGMCKINKSEVDPNFIIFNDNVPKWKRVAIKDKITEMIADLLDMLEQTYNDLVSQEAYIYSQEHAEEYFNSNSYLFLSDREFYGTNDTDYK